MRKFDTKVQYLKYKVLREVARHAFEDRLMDAYIDIPYTIVPGNEPTMRCCVYKERAIVNERIHMAMGGYKENPNVIEVISIACDECPMGGYEVTESCRGCLAHRCEDVCPRHAISFDEHQKAHIDKEKCVNCGRCAKVCPYSAISNKRRPCEIACKVDAISTSAESKAAQIDNSKCISCGSCVYMCPWGAIVDKSFIVDVVKMLKESDNNQNYKVYAVVAPSISGQFSYAKLGQVITAIKKLGFHSVVEVALGADMVAYSEAAELAEKGFLTSSCCPAFVDYIHKKFPQMKEHVSHNLSPMGAIGQYIKEIDPTAKIVFIGPCTAKKMEFQKETVSPYIDAVLTFEELQALFDSRDMEISELEEDVLDNASYYGRIFARSGGLSDAVAQALKEQGLDFEAKPVACDGIEACRMALLKASKNVLPGNFIEGMACIGGCIGGAGCLTHEEKNKAEVDKYGREAYEKTISEAIGVLK
ncbi:MAG TPA: ferredoxin [Ruminococcaceae bacterium]|nr:4Fe-4S dicluster domain-containing protein [Oscillospiraceae bacterium]HAO69738.1 ferredoxin [Oscillospiraceae bacterium]HCB65936.1 ferredoxin [Oscillospiraceae bacterium]